MTRQRGILYIATGQRFVDEAIDSAATVRRHSPHLPIALITDRHLAAHPFDMIIPIDQPAYSFADKPRHMPHSPFEQTLFLDTDVHVHGPIDELFALLARFDLAAAHDPTRINYESEVTRDLPATFPELNTGVVLYRMSGGTRRLFAAWNRLYNQEHAARDHRRPDGRRGHNQQSFRAACFHTDVALGVLPDEYNFLTRYSAARMPEMRIEHRTERQRDAWRAALLRTPGRSPAARRAAACITTLRPIELAWLMRVIAQRIADLGAKAARRRPRKRNGINAPLVGDRT